MILTADASDSDFYQTDVAVIGAGASGMTLASNLSRDVVVIDGGVLDADPERDKEFAFETAGLPMNTQSLRRRLVGGAAALWSGRCAELNAADFVPRSWMPDGRWPIGIKTLKPYFGRAWRSLNLSPPETLLPETSQLLLNGLNLPDQLTPQLWQFAFAKPETPLHLGAHFIQSFKAANRTLLTAADVIEFAADGSKITTIKLVDRNGGIITVKANHFVLACGCIEANRLLLDNADNCRALIGPVEKWLGRGFHQHLLMDIGPLTTSPKAAYNLQKTLNRFRLPPAQSYELGLRLSQETIMAQELTSASATFRYSRTSKLRPQEAFRLATAKVRGKEPIFTKPQVNLELSIEQNVDPANTISLTASRDINGRRKPTVHWSINDLELRSATTLNNTIASWLKENRLGAIPSFSSEANVLKRPMRDSLHHMGGTKMSEGPENGVVDADLTMHGAANLSIVGGSVFSSGGHVNPTLTMIALALRLADHLNMQTY